MATKNRVCEAERCRVHEKSWEGENWAGEELDNSVPGQAFFYGC